MNRKILRQIAKKYGVSVEEVKRDMQEAINEAYKDPNSAALSVERKGKVPTPDELINHAVREIKKNEQGKK